MDSRLVELSKRIEKARPIEADAIISSFVEENRGDFPLVEDSLVTFVYHGKVALKATVPSDINRWDVKAQEMTRLGETNLRYLTLTLPLDARIDYKFYVDQLWMLDPLNQETVLGGFGPNSAFNMPGYVPPAEIEFVDSVDHGTVEEHEFTSEIIPTTRKIYVYLPVGYGAGTYPVIFVQDGGEYISLASIVNVLDNTIYEGRIPPLVGVFIDPVDRNYEYFVNPEYERILIEEILPLIRANYDVSQEARDNAIMGASLGGAISFMVAMDRPDVFGKCGSQSGAFEVDAGRLLKMAGESAKQPVDIYLDCGTYGDLLIENRNMNEILAAKGYRVKYQEFNEGHSWGNWRAHIDDMLVFFWGKEGEAK
jgi:enterochelin esterase family protein